MNDEEYMEIAYQEALKALEYDDVPIGCIIVKDDEIIAKAYNQREQSNIWTCRNVSNRKSLSKNWKMAFRRVYALYNFRTLFNVFRSYYSKPYSKSCLWCK